MPRGAPLTVLDDTTPLAGRQVDVARRIGWTARMVRLSTRTEGPAPSLDQVGRALGVSTARLHRLETGQLRDGSLLAGYERLLGLPPGSVRAPVDVLCRTFPGAAPTERVDRTAVPTVRAVSAATERVGGPDPTAGDWYGWARAMAAPGNVGLPERLAVELVERLARELNRSVGHAYPGRYEALATLRESAYGHLVLEVARGLVADPHVQVLFDLMSGVGEAPDAEAVAWCLDLLGDPRDRVVGGSVLGLENMAAVSTDPDFWAPVAPVLVDRLRGTAAGSARWEWLSHLARLAPAELLREHGLRPGALAPAADIADWSRGRVNTHWVDCQDRGRAVAAEVGLPEQPMLARLLFDLVYSPLETHAVTSYFLLSAVPRIAGPVGRHVAEIAESHPDPVVRRRTARRLAGSMGAIRADVLRAWWAGDDEAMRAAALRIAGAEGIDPGTDVLRTAVAAPGEVRSAALYAAGLGAHPVLDEWVADADADLAGAAGWWRAQGARVTD